MPKAELKGFEDIYKILNNLSDNAEKILKNGLYEGAGIMAEELKAKLNSMPVVGDKENLGAYKRKGKYKLSFTQRKGLIESLGISPFGTTQKMEIETHIGFDGYNNIKTKKYPNGQPNQLIARIVESGSTYMDKTPFIRPALNSGKKRAEEKMKQTIEDEIIKLTKE